MATINAKAETLMTRTVWRVPFQRRCCLVPADGFYEWKVIDPKTKQPYAFSVLNGGPFAFAGLWDAWNDPTNDQWLQRFTIITTDPNQLTAKVHNRMPVIIEPKNYDRLRHIKSLATCGTIILNCSTASDTLCAMRISNTTKTRTFHALVAFAVVSIVGLSASVLVKTAPLRLECFFFIPTMLIFLATTLTTYIQMSKALSKSDPSQIPKLAALVGSSLVAMFLAFVIGISSHTSAHRL